MQRRRSAKRAKCHAAPSLAARWHFPDLVSVSHLPVLFPASMITVNTPLQPATYHRPVFLMFAVAFLSLFCPCLPISLQEEHLHTKSQRASCWHPALPAHSIATKAGSAAPDVLSLHAWKQVAKINCNGFDTGPFQLSPALGFWHLRDNAALRTTPERANIDCSPDPVAAITISKSAQ